MQKIDVSRYVVKEFRAAEAIKTLRTNLMFSGDRSRTVALTSFSSEEGKSTVAFQLAASLAQAGKRVLLLDADLRKSVMPKRLGVLGKTEGLSHYLSGMSNVSELLYRTDIPDFYIMFAGVSLPNAAELLGSQQFRKLISALRMSFDYTIIDSAPLGQVVDCAVIAPEVDGVLLVIDTTNNKYKLIRRIKNQLERSGGKVLGAVLNLVDYRDERYSYNDIYGAERNGEQFPENKV